MEQLFVKLMNTLTDPVNLVLLLWLWWMIKDRGDLIEINDKLLEAQQNRGMMLTKLLATIDTVKDLLSQKERA